MDNRAIQRVLAKHAGYKGGIDGILGPASQAAIERTLRSDLTLSPAITTKARRAVAAVQILLNKQGFEAGKVDGFAGHNTENALRAWEYKQLHGEMEIIPKPVVGWTPPKADLFPRQHDCPVFYGAAGEGGPVEKHLVYVESPYLLRLDFDLKTNVKRIRIHEKCADTLSKALDEILKEYGITEIKRLGLDRYAGSYMPRKMRGGTSWSMHAYGCAIDWYAAPNGLTTKCPDALFCGKEYTAFFDIWESVGWLSLGRSIGRDYMHVQAARL